MNLDDTITTNSGNVITKRVVAEAAREALELIGNNGDMVAINVKGLDKAVTEHDISIEVTVNAKQTTHSLKEFLSLIEQ